MSVDRTHPSEDELARQRSLAAEEFPVAWAAALEMPGYRGGRRRARLRQAALAAVAVRAIRAGGHGCADCAAFSHYPGPGAKGRMICDDDSDFHGYAITTAEDCCPDWRAKGMKR